jgi:hypothetical protein
MQPNFYNIASSVFMNKVELQSYQWAYLLDLWADERQAAEDAGRLQQAARLKLLILRLENAVERSNKWIIAGRA